MAEAVAIALVAAHAAPSVLAAAKPSSAPAPASFYCGSEPKAGALGLRHGITGWTLDQIEGDPKLACNMKATDANLNVLFPDNTESVALAAAPVFILDAQVAPSLPPRRFDVAFVEPVLCESYYPDAQPDLLALRLTDPNGRTQVVEGLNSLNYRVPTVGAADSARFSPSFAAATFGPWAQCYAIPYTSLPVNAPDIPASANAVSGSVFFSGFEDQAPASQRADLRLEILDGSPANPDAYRRRNMTETVNTPFDYVIRVRNAGLAAASGLRLREYLSDTGVVLTPLTTAQGWTCLERPTANGADTACGSGTGILNVGGTGFSLAPGAQRTYTLTRTVPSPAVTGQRVVLASALFYDPTDATGQGDASSADNVASAVISLVENQGPTITCVANPGGTALPATISLQEDAVAQNYTCSLTDAETDAITSFVVTGNSNTTLLPTASLLGARVGDTFPLTIAPVADRSGSAQITLTATDARAATRALSFTVDVASVNDAPSFDMAYSALQLDPAGGLPRDGAGNAINATRNGCLTQPSGSGECTISIPDFFVGVDAGPPTDEGGQTVTPVAPNCVGTGGLVGQVFTTNPTGTPASAQASGSNFGLSFSYDKSFSGSITVRCNMRFQDSGSPAATSIDSASLTEITFTRFAGS